MNIGLNIKKIRLWKNIGQKEICSKVNGLHQGSLSKIESGGDVSWSKLIAIASSLGMSIQELVCFDSNSVTFNISGEKAKGLVINQGINIHQLQETIQLLKEENAFLRKMLEKSIKSQKTTSNKNKRK